MRLLLLKTTMSLGRITYVDSMSCESLFSTMNKIHIGREHERLRTICLSEQEKGQMVKKSCSIRISYKSESAPICWTLEFKICNSLIYGYFNY